MNSAALYPWSQTLAQEYAVVARAPDDTEDRYWFFLNIGFAALSDGTLLAAGSHVVVGPGAVTADGTSDCCVVIARSADHGKTWTETARIPFRNRPEVTLYTRENIAYLIAGLSRKEGVIMAAASKDKGATWSQPTPIIRWSKKGATGTGKGGNDKSGSWEVPTEAVSKDDHWYATNQTAMVEKDDRLYLAVGENCQTMGVAVCDLAKGLLNPQAWRITDQVEMPIPKELNPGLFPGPAMRCLEGNIILIKDRLRVLARAVIDRYGTANLAAVFDLEDNGEKVKLSFTQFYPIPGGQGKFFIIYDERSRLYWMASNLPANTQGWVESPAGAPRGNDRRFLMLWYACDALNWFPAGCIARTEKLTESFMYPVMIIENDDLAILVRTSVRYSGRQAENRAKNGFHDANRMTFHRVRNFRSLAMNILPQA
ncbi:MAG: exo-alpha-sialidase [Verrucomicrobia bacterium]|nr:exo-alpha-sialidase [Verrucomicrobiota bacterium]